MSTQHAERSPWARLGLIVEAPGGPLTRSHAIMPTPLLLDDRIRVFFSSCDSDMRGRVFFADLERDWPHRVKDIEERPAFDLGERGAFDADGVTCSQVLLHKGELLLAYVGWQRQVDGAPYTMLGGLAVSRDQGQTFERITAPLLPRSPDERLIRSAPFIVPRGDAWEMLYLAGSRFVRGEGGEHPVYSLVRSRSDQLHRWPARGEVLLEPDLAVGEIGFGRPVIWRESNGEHTILLSRRSRSSYVLEQASYSAITGGIGCFAPALTGPVRPWESEMSCSGAPLRVGVRELLFYNGNQRGRTGFGLACREQSSTDSTSE